MTAAIVVGWTLVEAPLVLAVAFGHAVPASITIAVVSLVALIVLLTAYAVPVLMGGKM